MNRKYAGSDSINKLQMSMKSPIKNQWQMNATKFYNDLCFYKTTEFPRIVTTEF